MKYYIDESGKYIGAWDKNQPNGAIEVPYPPDDARQIWIGGKWAPLAMTEEEMKAFEIEQDKAFLASTDWIIAKIGEATFIGQDTATLISRYAVEIERRELARVRIRIAEGRA